MVKTQSMLISTPFARTKPKSMPILKLINTSASNPTMVVIALLAMEEKAFRSAVVMACVRSGFFSSS